PFTTSRRLCALANLTASATSAALSAATMYSLGFEIQASIQPRLWVKAGVSLLWKLLRTALNKATVSGLSGALAAASQGETILLSRPPTALPRLAQAAPSGQPASPGRTRLRAGAASVATGDKPVARERAATPFSRLRLSMAKSSHVECLQFC